MCVNYFHSIYFSNENKMNDSKQSEKGSKNGENANTEVDGSEKDENATNSVKTKENDEYKDTEENANDIKSRMYI